MKMSVGAGEQTLKVYEYKSKVSESEVSLCLLRISHVYGIPFLRWARLYE